MSKLLMESLKMDLPALADMIRSKGRGRDTILAHITPKEAALLKKRGGSGTINPDTGLPEFEDGGFDVGSYFGGETGGTFTPTEGASFQAPTDVGTYTPTYAGEAPVAAPAAPAFDLASQPGYGTAQQRIATPQEAMQTAAFMQGEPGQLTPAWLS